LFHIDQIHDQAAQLGRVLNLVLRLAKNDAEHSEMRAQLLQRVVYFNIVQRLTLVAPI
jgi:hypothetical protein